MSTLILCPICGHQHDVSSRVTGDVVLCMCGSPLLVQHGVGTQRITQLRPDSSNSLWAWLEAEVAALWMEIYRNRPDLADGERLAAADELYASPPALLLDTLAYAREWDADVAALRDAARAKRIEEAAWALRVPDLWEVLLNGGQG